MRLNESLQQGQLKALRREQMTRVGRWSLKAGGQRSWRRE
jgi:hypothetical protein